MTNEIKDKILTFIYNKKITKDFQLDERDLINEVLDLHSIIDKENEIVLLFSTDIFPETLFAFGKTFILFDLQYIKYIECFYSNLLFIKNEIKNKKDKNISILVSNMKSDLYHFLALKNYTSPIASLAFLLKAQESFQKLDLQLELGIDEEIFFKAVNIYLIRHEIAHTYYSSEKSKNDKTILKQKLSHIVSILETGKPGKPGISLKHFEGEMMVIENERTCKDLRRIISRENIDFEEMFCDFIAFMDTLYLLDIIYPETNPEKKYRFHIKLIEHLCVFDYLNQILRQTSYRIESILKNKKLNELNTINLLRYSIGFPLRILILQDIDGKESISKLKKDDDIFESFNVFQDIIFERIYKNVIEINKDKELLIDILQSNRSWESATKERDKLLQW